MEELISFYCWTSVSETKKGGKKTHGIQLERGKNINSSIYCDYDVANCESIHNLKKTPNPNTENVFI